MRHMTTQESLIEPEIVFPPPPKTVEVWCPHMHEMIVVLAYGHRKDLDKPLQRVRWNMTEGRWEVDPDRAKWIASRPGSNSKVPWVLATVWPADMKRPKSGPTKLERRVEELERQIAILLKTFGLDATDIDGMETTPEADG
jgi:hypothetical protein